MIRNLEHRKKYELDFDDLHIGDRVRVKSSIDGFGDETEKYLIHTPGMSRYCGCVGVIYNIDYRYKWISITFDGVLGDEGFTWITKWLEKP